MKSVKDGLPSQKDLVLCDVGEDFLVPAIFYKSMRESAGTSGFYHFSTYYHTNKESTYVKARTENCHEVKGVQRWMPMPEPDKKLVLLTGSKVHYVVNMKDSLFPGKSINGIIKSLNEMDDTVVFVVYNCGGEWENYQNYTGASTKITDLKPGWHDE